MAYLAGIYIYPIKSLDRVALDQATVLESGALKGDRQFAMFDQQGRFINGKRNPKVHLLRAWFDLEARTVRLQGQGSSGLQVFDLTEDRPEDRRSLETWLSDFFAQPVQLKANPSAGFPDDTHAPGPTVISTGTLIETADWFPSLNTEDMRLRLRTNLEIGDVPPFWEDQLFGNQVVQFQIGQVLLEGVNPCQRCIVPVRDPSTAATYPGFQKIFRTQRQATLPAWTQTARFNHFYRLAVNTRIPASEAGKILGLGNSVKILSAS